MNIKITRYYSSNWECTWELPKECVPPLYNLYLYRTTEQISSYEQLKGIEPSAKLAPETSSYTDTIEDLRNYYYTVISETSNGIYDLVLPSFNSTIISIQLKAKLNNTPIEEKKETETLYPDGTLRKTPLPYIGIVEGIDAEPLVSEKTAEKAANLTEKNNISSKNSQLSLYIFEEDLISPDGGDDYLLFEILKTSFVTRKYKESIEKLKQLIGTNISEKTRNRAYFYLGEAQYFNHDYEDSVRSFVKIQQVFPNLSNKWIEASLDKL